MIEDLGVRSEKFLHSEHDNNHTVSEKYFSKKKRMPYHRNFSFFRKGLLLRFLDSKIALPDEAQENRNEWNPCMTMPWI